MEDVNTDLLENWKKCATECIRIHEEYLKATGDNPTKECLIKQFEIARSQTQLAWKQYISHMQNT